MAVVRIEIDRREPVLNGAAFGEAGAYEKIVGMLHFAVDPSLPVNERIADIQRAPRNAQGAVLSSADFYLLRPVGGGSRRLLLDVPNRGARSPSACSTAHPGRTTRRAARISATAF
jgi:hypothetical protein